MNEIKTKPILKLGHNPKINIKAVKTVNIIPQCLFNENVFIIGGGPSIKNLDIDRILDGYKVLGINDAYLFDCCDICFFGDKSWFDVHKDYLLEFKKPIYTTAEVEQSGIIKLEQKSSGFIKSNIKVGWNCNSGFAGINLALNMGAKNIFLLGFDMQKTNEESNWHENIRQVRGHCYTTYLKFEQEILNDFEKYFSDRNIYNCIVGDIDSKLSIFPKVKLYELFSVKIDELYINNN